MKIQLLAIGTKMPNWIQDGFLEYKNRLNQDITLTLTEIPAFKRGKGADLKKIMEKEGEIMLNSIPKGNHVVSLDLDGVPFDTPKLADTMAKWQQNGKDITLLVGGPEGLSSKCKLISSQSWCLSNLTLPHPLVRIIVAESLYRGWSILNNHPYHRI